MEVNNMKKVQSSASPQDLAFKEDFLFHQSYWGTEKGICTMQCHKV